MKLWMLAFGVAAFITAANESRAEDDPVRVQAKQLAYAGVEAYQAGDFRTASAKLEKAFAMLPVPSIGLYSARALVSLGSLLEAERRYRQIAELAIASGDRTVQERARSEAASELEGLKAKIPRLRVQVEGAPLSEVQISIDGVPVDTTEATTERPLNPGTHRIESHRGTETVPVEITLREGGHSVALVRFVEHAPIASPVAPDPSVLNVAPHDASPAHSSVPWRTVGWVGVGIGGATLALSGISALVANSEKPSDCSGHVCQGSVESYNGWRTVSAVSFWSGLAIGIGGAAIVLALPTKQSKRSEVALSVSASGISLKGTY